MSDVFGPRELLLGDPGQQDARGVGDPFLVLTDRHQGVVGDLGADLAHEVASVLAVPHEPSRGRQAPGAPSVRGRLPSTAFPGSGWVPPWPVATTAGLGGARWTVHTTWVAG